MEPWLAAWEKSAAEAAQVMVRDPHMLQLGAEALKAHLVWRKSWNDAKEAAWAPFLAQEGK
jgi:hypothetical protein